MYDDDVKAETERDLPAALSQQTRNLGELENALANLKGRLEKVLVPLKNDSASPPDSAEDKAPLTNLVLSNNKTIRQVVERIEAITARLEL